MVLTTRPIGSTERPASSRSPASCSSWRTDRSRVAGSTVGSIEPPFAAGAGRQTDRRPSRCHSSCGNSRWCWPSARIEPRKSAACASFSLRAGKRGRSCFAPFVGEGQVMQPYLTPGDVQTRRGDFRQRRAPRLAACNDRGDASARRAFAEIAGKRACGRRLCAPLAVKHCSRTADPRGLALEDSRPKVVPA